jgi:hypothetical protein
MSMGVILSLTGQPVKIGGVNTAVISGVYENDQT